MTLRLLNWCKRAIATPSVTTEGTRRLAELLAQELLAPAGIRARLIPSLREGGEQVNLLALIPGRERTTTPLVLNTHLDTVPPGAPEDWTACGGNPFAPTVDGDRIHGLGAADTKLDFVAKTAALLECPRPVRDVYLVGTFGEEHGLLGAKELVETGMLPAAAMVFVGEPSGLRLITAHKGLLVFALDLDFTPARLERADSVRKATFVGRAAHSSTPELGRDAIRAALAAVAALPALKIVGIEGGDTVNKVAARCEVLVSGDSPDTLAGASQIERVEDRGVEFVPAAAFAALARFVEALHAFAARAGGLEEDFTTPTLTCNPGVVRTRRGRIRLDFELRPPPGLPPDVVRNGVEALVGELAAGVPEVQFSLAERRANPGFRAALDSETVCRAMAAMAAAGLPLETGVKAGCTEAGVYAAAGLRPVVFGPGPSAGVIHAPNEHNFISEVEGAIRFYRALLHDS